MRARHVLVVLVLLWAGLALSCPERDVLLDPADDDTDDDSGDDDTSALDDDSADDPTVYPGAEETLCDGEDSDCDGDGLPPLAAVLDGQEYDFISHALGAAADGETVYVCPGVHVEPLQLPGAMTLTLAGWSGDASDTVLDGLGTQVPVRTGTESVVTLQDLTIYRGLAQSHGGGIWSEGAALTLIRCVFEDNVATANAGSSGGAVYATGGAGAVELVVEDCRFADNLAGYNGGAISLAGNGTITASISNSEFEGNQAGIDGGAIEVAGWDPDTLQVVESTFRENTSVYQGGAIVVGTHGSDLLEVSGCTFEDNASDQGGAIAGIGDDPLTFVITDSEFDGNVAVEGGGALASTGRADLDLQVSNSHFLNNDADDGGVLGLSTSGMNRTATFEDTVMEFNTGVAIGDRWGITRVDIVITGGAVTSNPEGGVYLGDDSTLYSSNTDWGIGFTENSPFDIDTGAGTYGYALGSTFYCWGGGDCS